MFKFLSSRHGLPAYNPSADAETTTDSETLRSTSANFLNLAESCCYRGFPSKPSCFAFDHVLRIIAIGTREGEIRIHGKPGFHLFARSNSSIVNLEFFPGGQGRLIALCESGKIEIWEIIESSSGLKLKCKRSSDNEISLRLRMFTAFALLENGSKLAIGIKCGDILFIHLSSIQVSDSLIRKVDVHQSISERYRNKSGVVEAICAPLRNVSSPLSEDRLLIGYTKGLIVLWSLEYGCLERMFIYNQQIECLCWYSFDGDNESGRFISSHSDGSYILWKSDDDSQPQIFNSMPYGPLPCCAISRIIARQLSDGDVLIVFNGGLEKTSYTGKSCVSLCKYDVNLRKSKDLHAFELASRVVDLVIVDKGVPPLSPASQNHRDFSDGNLSLSLTGSAADEVTSEVVGPNEALEPVCGISPQLLFILTEQELVAIDLQSYLPLRLPYLNPIHYSPITTMNTCELSGSLVDRLNQMDMSAVMTNRRLSYSDREWPELGGFCRTSENSTNPARDSIVRMDSDNRRKSLVTGHEDGSLCFWDLTDYSFPLLFTWVTDCYFYMLENETNGSSNSDNELHDNWPPFKQVGLFDDRFGPCELKIEQFDVQNEGFLMTLSNAAGFVMLFKLESLRDASYSDQVCTIDLVNIDFSERKSYLWPSERSVENEKRCNIGLCKPLHCQYGYKPMSVIKLYPHSVKTTCVRCLCDTDLLIVGTNCGFLIYDFAQMKTLIQKITSSPVEMQSLSDPRLQNDFNSNEPSSSFVRGRSLKKSLRESFRRLRKNKLQNAHSFRYPNASVTVSADTTLSTTSTQRFSALTKHKRQPTNPITMHSSNSSNSILPVERKVESKEFIERVCGDRVNCVSCIYTCCPSIISSNPTDDISILIGTNHGQIYAYGVQLPSSPAFRSNENVFATLTREIHLRHRAPIISMAFIFNEGYSVVSKFDWNNRCSVSTISHQRNVVSSTFRLPPIRGLNRAGDAAANQDMTNMDRNWMLQTNRRHQTINMFNRYKLVVCTEEQLKVFDIGQLRQFSKYKVTALHGSRIKKAFFSNTPPPTLDHPMTIASDQQHSSNLISSIISCLTNAGNLLVFNLPHLQRVASIKCTQSHDILGLTHFCSISGSNGKALVLSSPGEVREIVTGTITGYSNHHTTNRMGLTIKKKNRVPIEDEDECRYLLDHEPRTDSEEAESKTYSEKPPLQNRTSNNGCATRPVDRSTNAASNDTSSVPFRINRFNNS